MQTLKSSTETKKQLTLKSLNSLCSRLFTPGWLQFQPFCVNRPVHFMKEIDTIRTYLASKPWKLGDDVKMVNGSKIISKKSGMIRTFSDSPVPLIEVVQ